MDGLIDCDRYRGSRRLVNRHTHARDERRRDDRTHNATPRHSPNCLVLCVSYMYVSLSLSVLVRWLGVVLVGRVCGADG
jgi:hypothetical protein